LNNFQQYLFFNLYLIDIYLLIYLINYIFQLSTKLIQINFFELIKEINFLIIEFINYINIKILIY